MKIGFIFPSNFSILSVLQKPLGGSESAVSFLATELSKLGHDVCLFSFCKQNIEVMGVRNLNITMKNNNIDFPKEILEEKFDFFVIKNCIPQLGKLILSFVKYPVKIFFWTGHAFDQPAIQELKNKNNIDAFNKIICVSNWQKDTFVDKFSISKNKIAVVRNAISPFFENLYSSKKEFLAIKPEYPCLTYTSTPFRGLDRLLKFFPLLKEKITNSKLHVYSSMQVYGVDQVQDQFKDLYNIAQSSPGVEYFGSVPQFKLAAKLRKCSIFSYPNTFAETSCIALMEAMAAGLFVITTDLGALSETAENYGKLISGDQDYLTALIDVTKEQLENKQEFYDKLYEQTVDINNNHSWRNRAREWVDLLSSV